MPNSSTRSTSTAAPLTTSPRSFLSRLAPSFASKPRNFTEFEIQLDDDHRQYSPGDVVKGTVVLKVVKPTRITHLVVALHGYVHVYKTPNTPGEGYRTHNPSIGLGKGQTRIGYFGNGFATLFEDEQVLCGDGKLDASVYKFGFALQFPTKMLPSSIDFERGTITYMLTTTLTRPTTMAPTTTKDRKVYLIENIDIGPISDPKPRIISLEPKSSKPKTKQPKKKSTSSDAAKGKSGSSDTSRDGQSSELNRSKEQVETPLSPARSQESLETEPSTTTGSVEESGNGSGSIANGSNGNSKANGSTKKPITATISLTKAGFLRGDTIQLKIKVNHTKYMKSLHGIIVTLYRQARVDLHPALPVITGKDGKTKSEEYFPRSKTGLGGLSLSNSGSTHVFRKDLSQSFAPLIVDPRTLTADVKATVRVPDEAFPTITNVPGGMITFKYYVEVVVDLQAKLTNLSRYFPNSGMMSMPEGYGDNPVRADGAGSGQFAAWGGNFIDTSQLRRDKSVVACVFGVIVGTEDSARRKNKGKQQATVPQPLPLESYNQVHEISTNGHHDEYPQPYDESEYYNYNIDHHDHYYDQYPYAYPDHNHYDTPVQNPQPPAFPLPPAASEDESGLTEKERIRRAEDRLLPSAPPPTDTQAGASSTAPHAPSAPVLTDDENLLFLPARTRSHANSSASHNPPDARPSAASSYFPPAPAPAYNAESSSTTQILAGPAATDDKEELQRRRMDAEASVPPLPSTTEELQEDLAPSAPNLEDLQLGETGDEVVVPVEAGPSIALGHDERRGSLLPAYEERQGI